MPTAGWFWVGLCLWTCGLAWFLGATVSAVRSIAGSLKVLADEVERTTR